ncbi:hypothetical protein TNCV_328891 [Trichonephila clavipes]|nr:hypothetical protein TNCV_328891 [Trichonephila clavipes]
MMLLLAILVYQDSSRTGEHRFIGVAKTSRNITAHVIERDTSGEIYYFLEGSKLANMVAKVANLAANWVSKNDANLALPPRFRSSFH